MDGNKSQGSYHAIGFELELPGDSCVLATGPGALAILGYLSWTLENNLEHQAMWG